MKIVIPLCLSALLVLGLGGCATAPTQVAGKAPAKKDCIRETGTRIKLKEGKCAPVNGRVYTADDLERTGMQTLNDAVNQLHR